MWLNMLAVVICVGTASAAQAAEIRCSNGKMAVTINLDQSNIDRRVVSCISGDFVSDLTPCAPPNGYGLSAPTGSGAIVGIVDHWRDFFQHLGGVTHHWRSASEIGFIGGFHTPGGGLQNGWKFTVERATGEGQLRLGSKSATVFRCDTKSMQKVS